MHSLMRIGICFIIKFHRKLDRQLFFSRNFDRLPRWIAISVTIHYRKNVFEIQKRISCTVLLPFPSAKYMFLIFSFDKPISKRLPNPDRNCRGYSLAESLIAVYKYIRLLIIKSLGIIDLLAPRPKLVESLIFPLTRVDQVEHVNF